MKRFVVSLLSSILAFTAGLVTASSWTSHSRMETAAPVTLNASPPCTPNEPPPPAPVQSYSVTPARAIAFGQNGLRLVPERVQLKSESQSYDVDVSYPQILGTRDTGRNKIRIVNQQIKDAATKLYQWPLELGRTFDWEMRAGARNTVNFTYHVGLATDSRLSISFIGYSYDGNNLRQLNDSFSVNYDLTTGKQLKLSEMFKPGSKYLEVIARYCTDELSKDGARKTIAYALEPKAENFQDWQITSSGITFRFYACKVVDCAEGDQTVEISFDSLQSLLNPGVPGKFNITYP
jgi:Protein of unknown function (DUF3298)